MSKRSSRRKTLSHTEIEDFLCDLGTNEPEKDNHLARESVATDDVLSSGPIGLVTLDNSEEHIVRQFCKGIRYQQSICTSQRCELGRMITERTKYYLLPERTINPGNFTLPPEALESKRELLLRLSPNIQDAEKQRQVDISTCEQFTRCKVTKSYRRGCSYEYRDIDNDMLVPYDEYERRYLMFLTVERGRPLGESSIVVSSAPTVSSSSSSAAVILTVRSPLSHVMQRQNLSSTTGSSSGVKSSSRRTVITPTTIGNENAPVNRVHSVGAVAVPLKSTTPIMPPDSSAKTTGSIAANTLGDDESVLLVDEAAMDQSNDCNDNIDNEEGYSSDDSFSSTNDGDDDDNEANPDDNHKAEGDAGGRRKKRAQSSRNSRRGTLSPGTVRSMMLEVTGGSDSDRGAVSLTPSSRGSSPSLLLDHTAFAQSPSHHSPSSSSSSSSSSTSSFSKSKTSSFTAKLIPLVPCSSGHSPYLSAPPHTGNASMIPVRRSPLITKSPFKSTPFKDIEDHLVTDGQMDVVYEVEADYDYIAAVPVESSAVPSPLCPLDPETIRVAATIPIFDADVDVDADADVDIDANARLYTEEEGSGEAAEVVQSLQRNKPNDGVSVEDIGRGRDGNEKTPTQQSSRDAHNDTEVAVIAEHGQQQGNTTPFAGQSKHAPSDIGSTDLAKETGDNVSTQQLSYRCADAVGTDEAREELESIVITEDPTTTSTTTSTTLAGVDVEVEVAIDEALVADTPFNDHIIMTSEAEAQEQDEEELEEQCVLASMGAQLDRILAGDDLDREDLDTSTTSFSTSTSTSSMCCDDEVESDLKVVHEVVPGSPLSESTISETEAAVEPLASESDGVPSVSPSVSATAPVATTNDVLPVLSTEGKDGHFEEIRGAKGSICSILEGDIETNGDISTSASTSTVIQNRTTSALGQLLGYLGDCDEDLISTSTVGLTNDDHNDAGDKTEDLNCFTEDEAPRRSAVTACDDVESSAAVGLQEDSSVMSCHSEEVKEAAAMAPTETEARPTDTEKNCACQYTGIVTASTSVVTAASVPASTSLPTLSTSPPSSPISTSTSTSTPPRSPRYLVRRWSVDNDASSSNLDTAHRGSDQKKTKMDSQDTSTSTSTSILTISSVSTTEGEMNSNYIGGLEDEGEEARMLIENQGRHHQCDDEVMMVLLSPSSSDATNASVDEAARVDGDDDEDEALMRATALARLNARTELARWKYHWEMSSFYCAKTAAAAEAKAKGGRRS